MKKIISAEAVTCKGMIDVVAYEKGKSESGEEGLNLRIPNLGEPVSAIVQTIENGTTDALCPNAGYDRGGDTICLMYDKSAPKVQKLIQIKVKEYIDDLEGYNEGEHSILKDATFCPYYNS